MPFTLPASTGAASLTDAATTEAQQKTNLTNLRGFLAEMLGTDSTDRAAARSLLGIDPPTFTATAAGGAITIALKTAAGADPTAAAPVTVAFRSPTAASGVLNVRKATAAASLVVPNGAVLGGTNNVLSRLIVLLIDNSGTLELAVVGSAGGFDLTETGVISTTAISAGSSAANVAYSTTARSSVPYRVLGYIESTPSPAGTWAAPTALQVAMGNAVQAMSSLGYGQSWQSVTRNAGTTYYNTTGRPIILNVIAQLGTTFEHLYVTVNSVQVDGCSTAAGSPAKAQVQVLIPPGASYSWNVSLGTTSAVTTVELR